MMGSEPYSSRVVGTTGCEILNPGGEVVAWTVDGYWAAIVLVALNAANSSNRATASNISRNAKCCPQRNGL